MPVLDLNREARIPSVLDFLTRCGLPITIRRNLVSITSVLPTTCQGLLERMRTVSLLPNGVTEEHVRTDWL